MGADGLSLYVPAQHRVALLAICPELAAVKVGVAVRALRSHVAEYRLGVAVDAIHFGVHSPQRIACLFVIEFRHRTDGLPTGQRVAVLTRNCQRPVRAACLLRGWAGILRRCRHSGRQHHENNETEHCPRSRHLPRYTPARSCDLLDLSYRLARCCGTMTCTEGQKKVHVS